MDYQYYKRNYVGQEVAQYLDLGLDDSERQSSTYLLKHACLE